MADPKAFVKQISNYSDRIAYAMFFFAIVLVIGYQIWLLHVTSNQAPYLEPDNYEYLLFANLSIQKGTFNVSNPYLVFAQQGFFEHPGLFEVPFVLHYILFFLPLFWSFRVAYLLAILTIYIVTLLIAKDVLHNTIVSRPYRYVAYALVLVSYFLMQQTEIIEWRGNPFILAFQLLILYVMSYIYTRELSLQKKAGLFALCLLFIGISYYIWSGWFVNLIALVALVLCFEIYKRLSIKQRRLLYRAVAASAIIIGILLVFFSGTLDVVISDITARFGYAGCIYNPLNLGEVSCLSGGSGLYTVILDMLFGCFTILTFLYSDIFANNRVKYEYLLVGSIMLLFLQLPVAIVYLRITELISPELALIFGLGVIGMFIKMGSSKLVNVFVIFFIFLSTAIAFINSAATTTVLYAIYNPLGLVHSTSYLSAYPNSTVLAFYAYGDYLEAYGHVKVYADTIQELNITEILKLDMFYNETPSVACKGIVELKPVPDFVLLNSEMTVFSIFANASNESLIRNPLGFEGLCGYSLAYQNQSFYVFKR